MKEARQILSRKRRAKERVLMAAQKYGALPTTEFRVLGWGHFWDDYW